METGAYLLELDPWTGSGVETKYFSGRTITTRPTDNPANVIYRGLIKDVGKASLQLAMNGIAVGDVSEDRATFILDNLEGDLDPWFDYGLDGRAARLKWLGDIASPISTATLLSQMKLRGIDGSDALREIRFRAATSLENLRKPLLTVRYAGTTTGAGLGIEGNVGLKGKLKPVLFGNTGTDRSIPCELVNEFDLIYQVSYLPVTSIVAYDGGLALTATTDYPTLAGLVGATIAKGSFATCVALGIFRLGARAERTVTADVVEGATASVRSAARVTQRILALAGFGYDAATFDAAAVNPLTTAEVFIHVNTDINILDVANKVMGSVDLRLIPDLTTATYTAVLFGPPASTPVDTYGERDIGAEGSAISVLPPATDEADSVPAWSAVLNWGPQGQALSSGDIFPAVSDARKDILMNGNSPAVAQDATVKTAHPKALELTFDTQLTYRADADVQAARLLAMYKVRRDRPNISLPFYRAQGRKIGETVAVQMQRLNYDGGRNVVIIGYQPDYQKRAIVLQTWG